MTTLVGIVSEKDGLAVILASDLSGTRSFWTPNGDVAYRRQTKQETQKIYVDDKGEVAIGMSGVLDTAYREFLSDLLGGEIDIKKSTANGAFTELLNLNLGRWEGRVPDTGNSNSLLIATRFNNKPMLYTCFPLGRMEERHWTAIGSGSEYALEHMGKSDKLVPKRLELNDALDLVVKSLDEASRDIYTGGLDLVIVRPKRIYQFGDRIKESLEESKKRTIESIKTEVSLEQ